jgi:hypothetical protein
VVIPHQRLGSDVPKHGTNETRRPNARFGTVWGRFGERDWRCSKLNPPNNNFRQICEICPKYRLEWTPHEGPARKLIAVNPKSSKYIYIYIAMVFWGLCSKSHQTFHLAPHRFRCRLTLAPAISGRPPRNQRRILHAQP